MRTPAQRGARGPKNSSTTIPAPITGWNARDALDLMQPTDAIVLDNWFPNETEVEARRGYSEHATGLDAAVETLLSYDSQATKKLFAVSSGNLYDVTSSGAVGAADITGLSNSRFQGVNLGTSGGHFLWICNGADAPRHYNGTTWATPSLTGVTAADISNVALHKRRLFVTFNNSLKFGYLAVNSIAGAVSEFDLASLFSMGGELQAIGSWTRDGGAGTDDLAVFVTSNGEVAIYEGTNPASASEWALVGIFHIGRPIGRRCLIKVGSDLVVITENGYLPLSQVLSTAQSAPNAAISDKVSGAVKDRARQFRTTFGWQGLVYPKGGYGLINVPRSTAGNFEQHVVNLNTGAWCRFTGQHGYSWAVHDGDLYFGASTKVFKADDGLSDDGGTINTDGKTAFQYFNTRGVKKHFTLAKPVLTADGNLPVSFGFDTDFSDNPTSYVPSTVTAEGSEWDEADWDDAPWASDQAPVQQWRTVGRRGYNISFRLRTQTTAQGVAWRATDVRWKALTGI